MDNTNHTTVMGGIPQKDARELQTHTARNGTSRDHSMSDDDSEREIIR